MVLLINLSIIGLFLSVSFVVIKCDVKCSGYDSNLNVYPRVDLVGQGGSDPLGTFAPTGSDAFTPYNETVGNQSHFLQLLDTKEGAVGDIRLICTAKYPVQWGFRAFPLWIPWTVSNDRKFVYNSSVNSSEEIFVSTLSYFRARRLNQLRNDYPTCYKSSDECIQGTVTSAYDSKNDQTRLAYTKGADEQLKPDAEFGKNSNCSLRMAYDATTETFYCQGSLPGTNLTVFPRTCSNPVMCRSVFMTPEDDCIITAPSVPLAECTEDVGCANMTYASDYLPAVAVCLVRGLPNEQQLANSVAMPFVYSLEQDTNGRRKRYIKYSDIEEASMLTISISGRNIKYAGESFTVECNSSYYYFSGGMQLGIERVPDGPTGDEGFMDSSPASKSKFTLVNQIEVMDKNQTMVKLNLRSFQGVEEVLEQPTTGKNGAAIKLPFLRYLADTNYSIPYPGTYRILCKAPKWNDTKWVTKSATVSILESSKPKFSGGNITETLYYKPDKSIDCVASGVPKPYLKWTLDDHDLPTGMRIYRGENDTKVWTTAQFPNSAHGVYGNFSCRATNYAGFNEKIFVVIPNDKNSSTPVIVIATMGVICLLFIPLVIFLVWKVQRQRKELRYLTTEEVDDFLLGKPDYIPFQCDMSTYAYYLPYDTAFEIPREQLFIDLNQILGSGAYGMVVFGRYNKPNLEVPVEVAVKTSKPLDDSVELFKALLSELKIMTYIGKHKNIVNLVGACTAKIQKREVFIALEFCENGSLLSFMRTYRHTFINPTFQNDDGEDDSKTPLSRQPSFLQNAQVQYVKMEDLTHIAILNQNQNDYENCLRITRIDLLRWAQEIAEGMAYLAVKKVIHGDLAARNVLLTRNLVSKIGDFGLSKRLLHYNSYTRTATTPVPIKWMAIECLQDFQFSAESDIWSYGVLLWEIFSLGEIPYASFQGGGEDFLKQLSRGMRLQPPLHSSPDVFDVMMKCWRHDRKTRPKFTVLSQYFKKCLETPVHAALALRISSLLAPTITESSPVQ